MTPEAVVALGAAKNALLQANDRIVADVDADGVPSRTGMAMLRDAADLVKHAVPEVGKLRRRK